MAGRLVNFALGSADTSLYIYNTSLNVKTILCKAFRIDSRSFKKSKISKIRKKLKK